jgi:hypothetical protein
MTHSATCHVKAWCTRPNWTSHALFLQVMKSNQRLYDNCSDYFMVSTQKGVIVYICSVMYTAFL